MRLINTRTLGLEEFFGDAIPRYAILSHTWGSGEVTFQDWTNLETASKKEGYRKIECARLQALGDGLDFLWVDTNCINKDSSAELTEAINSMYAWYRNAVVCYVYLEGVSYEYPSAIKDIKADSDFSATAFSDETPLNLAETLSDQSAEDYNEDDVLTNNDLIQWRAEFQRQLKAARWFRRGWTLQELLAPRRVHFYNERWSALGTKTSLRYLLSHITGIKPQYLVSLEKSSPSVSQRMSWVSQRCTTRVEDMAYCMLGLFDVNMPLLYGEGSKAFLRLQEEIIKSSDDQTIFCWHSDSSVPQGWVSMLAPAPHHFARSDHYLRAGNADSHPFSMTNMGLSIKQPLLTQTRSGDYGWLASREYWTHGLLLLNVTTQQDSRRDAGLHPHFWIPVWSKGGSNVFVRLGSSSGPIALETSFGLIDARRAVPIIVQHRREKAELDLPKSTIPSSWNYSHALEICHEYGSGVLELKSYPVGQVYHDASRYGLVAANCRLPQYDKSGYRGAIAKVQWSEDGDEESRMFQFWIFFGFYMSWADVNSASFNSASSNFRVFAIDASLNKRLERTTSNWNSENAQKTAALASTMQKNSIGQYYPDQIVYNGFREAICPSISILPSPFHAYSRKEIRMVMLKIGKVTRKPV